MAKDVHEIVFLFASIFSIWIFLRYLQAIHSLVVYLIYTFCLLLSFTVTLGALSETREEKNVGHCGWQSCDAEHYNCAQAKNENDDG